ncbi:hypothetical protein VPH35_048207 [Triticum aestivum]
MAADGSVPTAATERWSALPGDLLSVIYLRLVAGPIADRLSFAAVCGWWRAVASTHPPRRLLPWLVLDPGGSDRAKHTCCLEDGVVLPLRFHGWVSFLEAPLRIVNLFSGAKVTLSPKQRRIVRLRNRGGSSVDDQFVPFKVIFSSGCILAAITERDEVAVCGLGRPRCSWLPRRLPGKTFMDIAFCDGHLYCLVSETMEIIRFEVGLTKHGVFKSNPQWLFVGDEGDHREARDLRSTIFYHQYWGDPNEQAVYIVELHGKIMIAARRTEWSHPRNTYVSFFFQWKRLKSLGDHTLFLGSTFSKAMQMSTDENGYVQRNHIYYSHHRCYPRKESVLGDAEEFFTASNSDGRHVYYKTHYKEDESVHNNVDGITTVGHYVMGADRYPPVWLFPPDL